MSERANASVIPFKVEDEAEETAVEQASVENPAERLALAEAVRMAEAIVFASAEPVSEKQLAARLPDGINIAAAMADLQQIYARRGVNLVRVGDAWAFRTAGDLAFLMSRDT
ncbi:MAG: SMC-Scp complex subunit ScpB, partial [Mesorhizobium sp.]